MSSWFFVMIRRPPRSTRPYPLFPSTPLFRPPEPRAATGRAGHGRDRAALDADAGRAAVREAAPRPAAVAVAAALRRALQRTRLAHQRRSEEHTSELQSLMRISYAVFCLKNKINKSTTGPQQTIVEQISQ